jgi:hypothetical protein
MAYSLRRHRDGAGDSGGMSMALWEENNDLKFEHGVIPRVGICIRVGSIYARTMEAQDWWQTSYITEIISDEKTDKYHEIVFKTGNSTYTWRES